MAISKGGYETWVPATHANTLTGFDAGLPTRQTHLILTEDGLRTLTLTEWERLQCLPDGHTDVGISDSDRFTMLGNAMHAGMARWLGERLVSVHHAIHPNDRHLSPA
jgi:site-specific DNA-cytosine methylase